MSLLGEPIQTLYPFMAQSGNHRFHIVKPVQMQFVVMAQQHNLVQVLRAFHLLEQVPFQFYNIFIIQPRQ